MKLEDIRDQIKIVEEQTRMAKHYADSLKEFDDDNSRVKGVIRELDRALTQARKLYGMIEEYQATKRN